MKHTDNMYCYCYRYCEIRFKDKNMMSFHWYNDECEGWSGPQTLKMYPTFVKNDQTTLKVALDEHGLTFPSKHAGGGSRVFTMERRIRLQKLFRKTKEVNYWE